ncbi:MAG: copper-binding protein [Massilia sp.]
MNRFSAFCAIATLSLAAGFANAQVRSAHTAAATSSSSLKDAPTSSGEVKKIDKDAAKITIQHGPLANLGMPGMTMSFKVKDPTMLEQVKAGDKINFVADRINGTFTVTRLEAAK